MRAQPAEAATILTQNSNNPIPGQTLLNHSILDRIPDVKKVFVIFCNFHEFCDLCWNLCTSSHLDE